MKSITYIIKNRWNEDSKKRENVTVKVNPDDAAFELISTIFNRETQQNIEEIDHDKMLPYEINDLGIEILSFANDTEYTEFLEMLDDNMYKAIGKIRASLNTCATHYEAMFKKLNKDTANNILDLAEKHEEFHPDNLEYYRKMVNAA